MEVIQKLTLTHNALVVLEDDNTLDSHLSQIATGTPSPSANTISITSRTLAPPTPVSSTTSSSLTADTKPSTIGMTCYIDNFVVHIKESTALKTHWYMVYVGREIGMFTEWCIQLFQLIFLSEQHMLIFQQV
jgi:hypothetical protein